MLRIFVTGDNHIGLKYAGHEKSAELAGARIDALACMVERANAERCGLLVVTGDLFENTYGISKKDISAVFDMLAGFQGITAILPGNHDYYDKDSVLWQRMREAARGADNILLLTEYRPYSLNIDGENVIIYPALCTSRHSARGGNNLTWIKNEHIRPDKTYRIGVAHGAVEGETIDSEGRYFLMSEKELESIPVDAWLIGHTHVPFPRNLSESEYKPCERVLNAGTHVQTDVSCNTEGCCFIVEIDEGEGIKNIRAKKVISGNLRFYRKDIAVSAGEMESALKRALEEIPDNSVVDAAVSGAVSPEEYENRDDIISSALSRFVEGTYTAGGLSKLITEDIIRSEFPETSFSAGLLTALMDRPKEAQLAYELLKSIREGR